MSEARHLLIVNPQAKHGDAATLVPVVEKLLQHVPHVTQVTASIGHAVELAAAASDYDVVVAVGGDGTVHEILNGLMRIPTGQRPALAVLPTGSGNDTRRTLGVPTDLAQAALVLSADKRRRFDVGVCNGVYFNNSFATGLDARVTAKAVEYKVTKRRSGLWLYLTALFHVLFHELHGYQVRVAFDGDAPQDIEVLIMAVTNGPTYGGGFFITPESIPDDGLFDVCIIDPLGLPEALVRLPFVIAGKHTRMKPVHMSRHTSVLIESDDALPAQMDGEVMLDKRYAIQMLRAEIECVVP